MSLYTASPSFVGYGSLKSKLLSKARAEMKNISSSGDVTDQNMYAAEALIDLALNRKRIPTEREFKAIMYKALNLKPPSPRKLSVTTPPHAEVTKVSAPAPQAAAKMVNSAAAVTARVQKPSKRNKAQTARRQSTDEPGPFDDYKDRHSDALERLQRRILTDQEFTGSAVSMSSLGRDRDEERAAKRQAEHRQAAELDAQRKMREQEAATEAAAKREEYEYSMAVQRQVAEEDRARVAQLRARQEMQRQELEAILADRQAAKQAAREREIAAGRAAAANAAEAERIEQERTRQRTQEQRERGVQLARENKQREELTQVLKEEQRRRDDEMRRLAEERAQRIHADQEAHRHAIIERTEQAARLAERVAATSTAWADARVMNSVQCSAGKGSAVEDYRESEAKLCSERAKALNKECLEANKAMVEAKKRREQELREEESSYAKSLKSNSAAIKAKELQDYKQRSEQRKRLANVLEEQIEESKKRLDGPVPVSIARPVEEAHKMYSANGITTGGVTNAYKGPRGHVDTTDY